MPVHQLFDLDEFGAPKSDAMLQPYWRQLEFRERRIAFDMDMHRFVAVAGIEEEPVGTDPHDRRHRYRSAKYGIATGGSLCQSAATIKQQKADVPRSHRSRKNGPSEISGRPSVRLSPGSQQSWLQPFQFAQHAGCAGRAPTRWRSHENRFVAEFRITASLAALDRIPSGILLFDAGGLVTFANAAAWHIFEEADGLKLFQASATQRLMAHDAQANARLNEALATALDHSRIEVPHFGRCVAVPRRSQAIPLSVQFSALPVENEFGQGSSAPQAIAFITDCTAPPSTDAALLRQVFGLTPAEARAALALCDGGSIEETAVAPGVANTTLKTQLASIYLKTGVDTRAKLVRLILALAGAKPG